MGYTGAQSREEKRTLDVVYLPSGIWSTIDKSKWQRRVMTPLGEFASIKLAAEGYGVLGQTIHWWIERSRKPGF